MTKNKLLCPYYVRRFEQHDELKASLLQLIEEQNVEDILKPETADKISKTDWYIKNNSVKLYWNLFSPHLPAHLNEIFRDLQYGKYKFCDYWFQQYRNSDTHLWHRHDGCNWANVYYLELDKDSPPTNFMEPYTKEIIKPEVQEGDILTFPSFVMHCSPPNVSTSRKTIIAFNIF